MKEELLRQYKSAKRQLKEKGKSLALTRMIMENISEFMPDWELHYMYGPAYLQYKAPDDMKMPAFIEVIDRFAKKVNVEPEKTISKEEMEVKFYLRVEHDGGGYSFWNKWAYHTLILEFITNNPEPCEIIFKRKMQKVPVLTGYCKEIAEKKHLVTNAV